MVGIPVIDTGPMTVDEFYAFTDTGRDLRWKLAAYASLPSLTHYVAIAQDAVDIVVFARDNDFVERRLRSLAEAIELRSLAVSLPVAEIYLDTHLAAQV